MAKIKKAQNVMSWVIVASECSHIFCCVLPTLFSVLGVLVGLGLIGAVPVWMDSLHHVMHNWEIPIIAASGLVLIIGWALHTVSKRMDCHDTGCVHGACEPKKKNTVLILQIATVLFVVNLGVYLVFHRGLETLGLSAAPVEVPHHDHDHH